MAHFSYTLNLDTERHTLSSNMAIYSTFEIDFKCKQAELWIPQSFLRRNPFLQISHCVLCLDKNGERERKKSIAKTLLEAYILHFA